MALMDSWTLPPCIAWLSALLILSGLSPVLRVAARSRGSRLSAYRIRGKNTSCLCRNHLASIAQLLLTIHDHRIAHNHAILQNPLRTLGHIDRHRPCLGPEGLMLFRTAAIACSRAGSCRTRR